MHDGPLSPVLAALPHTERDAFLSRGVKRSLRRDDILYLAGDRSERLHVMLTGVLKLSARDSGGRETILGLAVSGDLVGELAAIDLGGQPLDAIATVDSSLLGFEAPPLLRAIHSSPAASRALAQQLAARTRWVYEAALERMSSEVPARLAARLLDLARLLGNPHGPHIELELPMPQADLGRLAGMCRESTCKTLRRFQSEGVVDYHGRKLRILRPEVLEAIKCAERGEGPSR